MKWAGANGGNTAKVAINKNCPLNNFVKERLLLVKSLREGSNAAVAINASIKAKNVTKMDSLKNCPINCWRNAPTAFRIPTSLARLAERAVAKFM